MEMMDTPTKNLTDTFLAKDLWEEEHFIGLGPSLGRAYVGFGYSYGFDQGHFCAKPGLGRVCSGGDSSRIYLAWKGEEKISH